MLPDVGSKFDLENTQFGLEHSKFIRLVNTISIEYGRKWLTAANDLVLSSVGFRFLWFAFGTVMASFEIMTLNKAARTLEECRHSLLGSIGSNGKANGTRKERDCCVGRDRSSADRPTERVKTGKMRRAQIDYWTVTQFVCRSVPMFSQHGQGAVLSSTGLD